MTGIATWLTACQFAGQFSSAQQGNLSACCRVAQAEAGVGIAMSDVLTRCFFAPADYRQHAEG
jgi:hypothetical protein